MEHTHFPAWPALPRQPAPQRRRDNRPGIADELRSRLFRIFEQGLSTIDRSGGGLGIGLALVKSFVELHGGTVRLSGLDVAMASDPNEALRLAETFQPSVALIDIGLPIMDGYALADLLRFRAGARPLRLIALSGYGQDSHRRRSLVEGFYGHFVKPVDLDQLLLAITESAAGSAASGGT